MIEEVNLQDIDSFSIFKEGGDSCPVREDSFQGDETIHSSQESLMLNEDSLSSMDIDLNVQEKVSSLWPNEDDLVLLSLI